MSFKFHNVLHLTKKKSECNTCAMTQSFRLKLRKAYSDVTFSVTITSCYWLGIRGGFQMGGFFPVSDAPYDVYKTKNVVDNNLEGCISRM